MSLQPFNRDSSLRPFSTGSTPSNARAIRRAWENGNAAGLEIWLRGRLGRMADDEIGALVSHAIERFGWTREEIEDIVASVRDGQCRMDTAAFADGMLRELALLLRDTTVDYGNSIREAGLRPFDADLPRSFWQRLLGQ